MKAIDIVVSFFDDKFSDDKFNLIRIELEGTEKDFGTFVWGDEDIVLMSSGENGYLFIGRRGSIFLKLEATRLQARALNHQYQYAVDVRDPNSLEKMLKHLKFFFAEKQKKNQDSYRTPYLEACRNHVSYQGQDPVKLFREVNNGA